METVCDVCKVGEATGYEYHCALGEPLRVLCNSCAHLIGPNSVFEVFEPMTDERITKLLRAMVMTGKLEDNEAFDSLLDQYKSGYIDR